MALVPSTKQGKIAFFQSKLTAWQANAVAMGSSVAAITAFQALVTAAADAMTAQDEAESAFRAKVGVADLAVDAMCNAGADVITQVRLKSRTAGDVVFTLAELPIPGTPTPVGTPGLPYKIVATLNPNGSLSFTRKCNNPRGCDGEIYQVYRKVDATGDYEYLGGSGERKFIDLTVPQGVPSVMYQIQGTRSTSVGLEANFTVNFGTTSGGGGMMTASVVNTTPKPAKIAA
jgi:hypothetical protein